MNKLSVTLTRREAAFGWAYLFVYLFLLPGALGYMNMFLPRPLPEARLNFLYFLINITSVFFIGWRFLLKSLDAPIRSPFRFFRYTGIALILYYCMNFLVMLVTTWLRPDFVNLNDTSILDMSRQEFTLMRIGTVFLVPPVEEFLFRGLVFGRIFPRSPFAAYGVSALVFAAIHVIAYVGIYDPGLLALSLLQYIPAGICLAWAYRKTDSIWAPILMHITINEIGMRTLR